MRKLRLGLAQINTTVGDFKGNLEKMLEVLAEARSLGVDLVVFPELAVCGYPPEDLLLKPQFIKKNLEYLDKLVQASTGLSVIAGFVDSGPDLYNAAAVIHDGRLAGTYHKIFLPNYGVFDEKRYFRAGEQSPVFQLGDIRFGVNICEDIWSEAGPATAQADAGAELIINISASPYHYGKVSQRETLLSTRARDDMAIVAYCNLVGGQDELVFDGNSLVINEQGQALARGRQFAEDFVTLDIDLESVVQARLQDPRWREGSYSRPACRWETSQILVARTLPEGIKPPPPPRAVRPVGLAAEIYSALVLGTQDYLKKNDFKKAVIGLSGGVDSSLVAALAVDALGSQNVIGVAMPSRYSSPGSLADAGQLARNLDIRLITLPIEKVFQAYLDSLVEVFQEVNPDITEENIQARIRGNFLMALSNKFGWLVLPTGNKSEMATGYATLYGDMAGGFAILKDVPKTMVYQLVRYRNEHAGYDLVPEAVIDKPPSAELRPDQRDSDSLPPYDILDQVLKAYVEEDKGVEQIIAMGLDEAAVRQAVRLVDMSEYKRRQAPPGIKITTRAFGRDRRLPITNKFRGNG
jgi:NAD+ synthase (glutamine-hydrolysing)